MAVMLVEAGAFREVLSFTLEGHTDINSFVEDSAPRCVGSFTLRMVGGQACLELRTCFDGKPGALRRLCLK
jgi:hypothetical protein